MHPFQQISQLISRYSENRNLGMVNNRPVVNSLWHGMLQKELTEKFNASRSSNQNDTNPTNCSSSNINSSCNLRGVMRYVD